MSGTSPSDLHAELGTLFDCLSSSARGVTSELKYALRAVGVSPDDPRVSGAVQTLEAESVWSRDAFREALRGRSHFIVRALQKDLAIPDWEPFADAVTECFEQLREVVDGAPASYIPQLAGVNPSLWAVSVTTVSGQGLHCGDADHYTCLQSTTKVMNYLLALEERGVEGVHRYVGREPSGQRFNSMTLNEAGLPHNPLINAGAIMTCALMSRQGNMDAAFETVTDAWTRACGGQGKVSFSTPVFLSERGSAHRNMALAHQMAETNASKPIGFPPDTGIDAVTEFYFATCSIEITTRMLSVMAATLANGGVCPITEERVFSAASVRHALSLMATCGMYDYSGEFFFRFGVPAKSGVSGLVIVVAPGVGGFAFFSPPLDAYGNSVRGTRMCALLTQRYPFLHRFHIDDEPGESGLGVQGSTLKAERAHLACTYAAGGDLAGLRQLHLLRVDLSQADYDGRTPLHLAASEGRLPTVRFLCDTVGVPVSPIDRWGNSPQADADRHEHSDISEWFRRRLELHQEGEPARSE